MTSVACNDRLLYFSPAVSGGIADYAREQANAMAQRGVNVYFLTSAGFKARPTDHFQAAPRIREKNTLPQNNSRLRARFATVRHILATFRELSAFLTESKCSHVLLSSYAEYLAPLWSGRLRRWARKGVVFGAVVHDPIRDAVVGPRWFHRWSVAQGYSFLREAFVHEEIQLDTVRPMPGMRTTVIPHGPYLFPKPKDSRKALRHKLCLPDDAYVALSFGHIRDGKNLDLVIQAMPRFSTVHLIVAGKDQPSRHKPIGFYQDLARTLQVHDRCHWIHGHIPEEEVGSLVMASDLSLLTYNSDFRSASGVLNAAVSYRKVCVASSGGGNLRTVVERYQLGWFVEPDNLAALELGIKAALQNEINPQWKTYEAENSWERNAQIVQRQMFDQMQ
jgi:glycosyltransferase involved in cell wall biosynthesis